MEEAELVQRYLRHEYYRLAAAMRVIFDRQPALAVRMLRSQVDLYSSLRRAVAGVEEPGSQFDLDAMERLLRDERD